jgi:hypothetical protein
MMHGRKIIKPDPNDGRCALGIGGFLFIPISVSGLYFVAFEMPVPKGLTQWLLHIVLGELAVAATLFFSIGFLWAVTGNRVLKSCLNFSAVKLAWIVIPIAVPFFAAAAWMFVTAAWNMAFPH